VLDALLSVDFDGVEQLRDQARLARVVALCDCGCPTVSLTAPDTAPSADLPNRLAPVWARVVTDGYKSTGEIVLLLKGGRLDSLEYVFYERVPRSWPPIDQIRIVRPTT